MCVVAWGQSKARWENIHCLAEGCKICVCKRLENIMMSVSHSLSACSEDQTLGESENYRLYKKGQRQNRDVKLFITSRQKLWLCVNKRIWGDGTFALAALLEIQRRWSVSSLNDFHVRTWAWTFFHRGEGGVTVVLQVQAFNEVTQQWRMTIDHFKWKHISGRGVHTMVTWSRLIATKLTCALSHSHHNNVVAVICKCLRFPVLSAT